VYPPVVIFRLLRNAFADIPLAIACGILSIAVVRLR